MCLGNDLYCSEAIEPMNISIKNNRLLCLGDTRTNA